MKILKQGNPAKVQQPKFTWIEKCACGAVLQVTRADVQCARDSYDRVIKSTRVITPHIACPSCKNKIKPDEWKYA
jgi:hypothetical protein